MLFDIQSKADFEEHHRSSHFPAGDGDEVNEQCPLCPTRSTGLRSHLLEEHKIAEEAIERLMMSSASSSALPDSTSDNSAKLSERHIYRFRCNQCSLAFRTEHKLTNHSLYHVFRASTRCKLCARSFRSLEMLQKHEISEHINGKSSIDLPSTSIEKCEDTEIEKNAITYPKDSSRCFRCDVCNESFGQRHQLYVHFNSLDHLHKAKKALEQQPNNLQLSAEVLAALQSSPNSQSALSPQQSPVTSLQKPYKCNLCKIGYSQETTLDIHIRSVGHQSRLSRIAELVAQGELDPSTALLELPAGPSQRTIGELMSKSACDQNGIDQQSALAMINMFNMAQLLSMASASQTLVPSTSANGSQQAKVAAVSGIASNDCASISAVSNVSKTSDVQMDCHSFKEGGTYIAETSTGAVDDRIPKTGEAFRRMLEEYDFPGLDVVMSFIENVDERRTKLASLPNEAIPGICECECKECGVTLSSIWILKTHCEEEHNSTVSTEEIDKFSMKLRRCLEEAEVKSSSSETAFSRRQYTESDGNKEEKEKQMDEPLTKKAREDPTSSMFDSDQPSSISKDVPDFSSQLAMMGMMGFPFLPNPFLPMVTPEFFANPMLAAQQSMNPLARAMATPSPTKRARTRITDDQLKILRQYFDINNSPSEQQIKEMSIKAQLPEKVIKHWFRNTLFKERQRDKDSPYNFSIPPQMSIDLDAYEKTGETKITALNIDTAEESKSLSHPATTSAECVTPTASNVTASLVATAATMPQFHRATGSANPFASFLHDDKGLSPLLSAGSHLGMQTQNSVTGRRANRTRFTDYQLRTLQQFFDKQAYPKDDDLEVLSKKLQLSPRVIVVWFQNARQKARKIYENQPTAGSDDRFMKTPGSNFQCKRCQVVFQRYYELIQHQQKMCYKNDCAAQQKDNKVVEENLSEDEKSICETDGHDGNRTTAPSTTSNLISATSATLNGALAHLIGSASSETGTDISRTDFVKMLSNSAKTQDSTLKLKVREKRKVFYKRCPFCCLLFHSRDSLITHLPERHSEQIIATPVDVDLLPDAEDVSIPVPTITTIQRDDVTNNESPALNGSPRKGDVTPLDLSCSTNGDGREDSLPMSPCCHSDNDDNASDNVETTEQYSSVSPVGCAGGSNNMQRSPPSSKRYRTHLTPLQVYVMKNIFNDYKTPSMTECDMLGAEIGLHKRVVQVWFQNARAKERKTRAYNGEDDALRPMAARCTLCAVDYSHRVTLHDHIFTSHHLNRVKKMLRNDGASETNKVEGTCLKEIIGDKDDAQRLRLRAVRDRKVSKPIITQGTPSNQLIQFPYNFMYGLQSGLSPMLYDPNLLGTPIPMLQIPEDVMNRITSDIAAGRDSTKFTQDGKTFQQLIAILPLRDFQCAGSKDSEVGWACIQCTNVFQQEAFLKNHQRLICQNSDVSFKLIQTHYECRACGVTMGTQVEFKIHCETTEHHSSRELFLGNT